MQLEQNITKNEEVPSENNNGLSSRSGRIKLGLVVAAILALAAVLILWRYYAVRESTDDAQIEGHVMPVSPRVSGTIAAVHVHEDQQVQAGALLVELDPADYRIALQRSEAEYAEAVAEARAAQAGVPIASANTSGNLSVARAGLAAAKKEVDAANSKLRSAQAHLREAEAMNAKVSRDLDRMKQLVAKDEVSQQQYDAAATSSDASYANLESARADVAGAEQQVHVAESHVLQAQAGVQTAGTGPEQMEATQARASSADAKVMRARAALDQAKLNLEYTKLRAPATGVVSKKSVELGQVVQAGQPLLAIVPLDDVWVVANFKETQLNEMKPGQRVVIKVDGYVGREYQGHVDSIAAATGAKFSLLPPENATGNYVKVVQRIPVRIVFDKGQNPDHMLRPGMSVVPTVILR
jgi:membrane fusion protein (multidrug efflux system)